MKTNMTDRYNLRRRRPKSGYVQTVSLFEWIYRLFVSLYLNLKEITSNTLNNVKSNDVIVIPKTTTRHLLYNMHSSLSVTKDAMLVSRFSLFFHNKLTESFDGPTHDVLWRIV